MPRTKAPQASRSASARKRPPLSAPAVSGDRRDRRTSVVLGLSVVALTLVVYNRVQALGFIDFDDPIYINHNTHILNGLTLESLRWAFTTGYAENWHPLTWASHMLDVHLFGLQAAYHHVTNLVLHAANGVLLFAALSRMTGALRRSALVAVLFAIHPLHVESVAWISERKDVLSTSFFMLTILAYGEYARDRRWWRYTTVVALFALGLMAKPMLVTLPFVLLLLDFWPLGRVLQPSASDERAQQASASSAGPSRNPPLDLTVEKVPLFALAVMVSVITFAIQKHGGAVGGLDRFPLTHRFANVPLAYVAYVGKMIVPIRLGVFYPYPTAFSALPVSMAVVGLVAASIAAIRFARSYPYLPVGWFWFLGMLVPVIGIVQVGKQSMADRYTYVPLVGLFIIIAWGGFDVVARLRLHRNVVRISVAIAVVALAVVARRQVSYWSDSLTLWRHTLEVTGPNARAHTNVGNMLGGQGDSLGAIAEYEKALQIDSTMPETHNNLAWYLDKSGRGDEALSHYSIALRLAPNYTAARNNFGVALSNLGRTDEAINEFTKSLDADPEQSDAHFDLALLLSKTGRTQEAIDHLQAALRFDPANANARKALALMQGTTK